MDVESLLHATPALRRPEASQSRPLRDAVARPVSSSHTSEHCGTSQLQTMRLAHKEGKGNKTAKRNLWLVSLLLVLSFGAMAPSLHAQGTQWSASSNQNTIRNEGDAEAVGTITLTSTSTGTIESSSGFTITYNLPVASYGKLYAVGLGCPATNSTPLVCGALTVSVTGKVVKPACRLDSGDWIRKGYGLPPWG